MSLESYTDDQVISLAKELVAGVPMASPVFDGVSIETIKSILKMAGQPESGQAQLYDGRTGLPLISQVQLVTCTS